MPFREKTAWISALSMLFIYGIYYASVLRAGPHREGTPFAGLLTTVIALVIVQAIATTAVAIRAPRDARAPRDERERLIDLRAARFAYSGLATGVALACLFAAFNPPLLFNANALLFILVTAELMRAACQIIQFRRTA